MKKFSVLFFTVALLTKAFCIDINWETPETLSASMVDASDPQIVIDADGNATAVWVESTLIKASTKPEGGSWGTVDTISGSGSSSPRLGINSAGDVSAVWIDDGIVTYASKPFGGSWSSTTALSGSGAVYPSISVNGNGDVAVVWERGGFIEAQKKPSGGDWNFLVSLISPANSLHPQVAIGSNGHIVAVWRSPVSGVETILSARSTISGAWSAPVGILTSGAYKNDYPVVVVDEEGTAFTLYFRYTQTNGNYTGLRVLSAQHPVGGQWSIPEFLTAKDGNRDPADLKLKMSMGPLGNILGIWSMSYNGSTFSIETATKQSGQPWGNYSPLVEEDPYAFQGAVSANALGDAACIIMFSDGGSTSIASMETQISGSAPGFFTPFVTVSSGQDNGYPQIASTFDGSEVHAAAVWVGFDGANQRIIASAGTRGTVAPPTNLSVMQTETNFGIFSDFTNTLSWDASPSMDLFGYVVYRNGVLLKTVDPGTLQILDQNMDENGSVTYGVAAIDNDRSQSVTETVTFP